MGRGLRRRGHEVTIATAEYYRDKVLREGLSFHPVRPDFVPMEAAPDVVRRSFDPRGGAQFVLRKLVIPYVEESYRDLLSACTGADLLVIHPTQFAAPLVAEKLGLKWVSVILSPSVFVSAYDPPIFPPVPWLHALRHFGPWPHRAVIRGMRHLTKSWMQPIVELRRREGLSPVRRCAMHADMFSPFGTLAWFSEVLGAPQPDWPPETRITGFPIYDRSQPGEDMEPELCRFLDDGEAPVVFTLGSSAVVDCGDFYEQSLAAVRRLGCRAVFLVGRHADAPAFAALPRDVFVTGYAPYSQIFPRAAAVVHQGGIGTVGQALHAGAPMLIVPQGLDQPDNAFRACRAGVARVLPRRQYTGSRADAHLRRLMGDSRYAATALAVRSRLQAEDGVEAAADALENLCAVHQPCSWGHA